MAAISDHLLPLPVRPSRRPRRRLRRLLFVGLACLIGLPVWAQDACDGAVNQMDLNDCTAAAFAGADEDLNLADDAALEAARQYDSSPDGEAEGTLRAAQRAWIAYRDAACEAEAALWDGGSAQPMIRSGCLEHLTVQRTEDLWAYAEQ
jgi:uncharacterized protein YecT (DUF1311 family)